MSETSSMLFNRRLIAFNAKVAEKKYWTGKLSGRKELVFPTCYSEKLSAGTGFQSQEFALDADLQERLTKICPEPQALFVLLTSVLSVQVYKFLDETPVTIGTSIERTAKHDKSLNHVLPLALSVDADPSFRDLLNATKNTYLEAKANQDYPLDLLLKSIDEGEQVKLFNIGITLRDIHGEIEGSPDIVFNFESGDKFDCVIKYNTSVYHSADVERIFNGYQLLLRRCLQYPDKKIKDIDALSEAERNAILHELNATGATYPSNASIVEIFEEQVKLRPSGTALIYNDEQLSYAALDDRAKVLAAKLISVGVKPQMNIALFQRMDTDYIVSVLAILKVRCVYVPISTQDPLTRIAWMLDEIKAEIILTTKRSLAESGIDAELLGANNLAGAVERTLVYADEIGQGQAFILNQQAAHSDIAYIMFTSGSTGKPKGVMVTHRNVLRLVCNTNYVPLSPDTRILLTGAPGFDATTFEIWGSLLNGGVLALADRDLLLDTELFHDELTRNNINTLWLTSAFFNQLVQQSRRNIFSGLSYLLTGGDIASPKHIDKVRNENPGLQVINAYGPTENTTFSLTMPVEKEYNRSIPIGKPINNSTAYVLDSNLNLKLIGAWGILYVGGDGVSAGYLNSPELTQSKFIDNPFGEGLLYKTDDITRVLPDLTIEFKGRADDQVKVRGFRITLGEIEHQLNKHESILESVVLVKEEEGDKHLAAYYVSPEEISAAGLKSFLLASLPDYMVPAYYVHLNSMPLTANGKINKKLLPDIQQGLSVVYEPPADEVEQQLTGVWSQLFQMDSALISATANFFDLGGHSLKATALMNNINRAFNTHILIRDIFAAPTIREQSAFIKMNKWATANEEYDKVEGMEIVI
jgi:tyrocidine synthetase-3